MGVDDTKNEVRERGVCVVFKVDCIRLYPLDTNVLSAIKNE